MVEKKSTTLVFFDRDCEEINNHFDDFHADLKISLDFAFSIPKFNIRAKINSSNFFFYKKLNTEVFSPPPEFS